MARAEQAGEAATARALAEEAMRRLDAEAKARASGPRIVAWEVFIAGLEMFNALLVCGAQHAGCVETKAKVHVFG